MSTQSYYLPLSIEEATNLLADKGPDLLVLAGGTLAMPLINEGVSTPEQVMGLKKVGLDYMKEAMLVSTMLDEVPSSKTAESKRYYTSTCLEIRNSDAFAIGCGLSA